MEFTEKQARAMRRAILLVRCWNDDPYGMAPHVIADIFEKEGYAGIGEIIGGLIGLNGFQMIHQELKSVADRANFLDRIEQGIKVMEEGR